MISSNDTSLEQFIENFSGSGVTQEEIDDTLVMDYSLVREIYLADGVQVLYFYNTSPTCDCLNEFMIFKNGQPFEVDEATNKKLSFIGRNVFVGEGGAKVVFEDDDEDDEDE